MTNIDVRKAIENAGLKYWQIADRLGVYDGNFSRMLRRELPQEKKQRIIQIIQDLKQEVHERG